MTRHLMLLVLLALVGCGTAPPMSAPAANQETVIRDLEEQERVAVLNRDAQALQRLWAEEFTVNSPANRISPDRAAVLDLMRQGVIHYAMFERRIEQVRIRGDLAIVMGGETVQPVGRAAAAAGAAVQRRFTHVWRRETGGSWRLVARHANNVAPARG